MTTCRFCVASHILKYINMEIIDKESFLKLLLHLVSVCQQDFNKSERMVEKPNKSALNFEDLCWSVTFC